MEGQRFSAISERVKTPSDPLLVKYFDDERYQFDLNLFDALVATHRAWLVMLAERGIVPRTDAVPVLRALKDLMDLGPSVLEYHPGHDLYTHVENWLRGRAGAVPVGHLSLARTRPEPLLRIFFRERILYCMEQLLRFRSTLLDMAEQHCHAVMPGYTHQQHAQPTTFGAYLLGIHDPLVRSAEWLEMAYRSTNQSTMGCGALAGTAFPIDRHRVAELLGFNGLMESTIACVSTQDYLVQAASAAADAMNTLSRMCIDLEQWANTDHGFLELAPQFSSSSSLMPQKKNPCSFEVARGRASRVLGNMVGVYASLHRTFYADVLDYKPLFATATKVVDDTAETLEFLAGVISTLLVRQERMLEATLAGFSTASELADAIYRHTGIPHRQAHSVVANVVTQAVDAGVKPTDVSADWVERVAQEVLGRSLGLSDEQVRKALDPVSFVESHDVVGGPSPKEVLRMVGEGREQLARERAQLDERRARLEAARRKLDEATEGITG
ncbi:MAG: argininosuccinate lyase [Anaerolineae bacterium]